MSEGLRTVLAYYSVTHSVDVAVQDICGEALSEIERLRSALADLYECAHAECVAGSSHEPLERARILLGLPEEPVQ